MRKFTLMMLCILFIATMANAANYFVDFSKANDTGDGTTWETAKKTLSAASALGTTGDNIYFKGGTFTTSAQVVFVTNINYYGSCDASNTGTATGRSTSDLDLNGITEPWEFTNPTLLSSTFGSYTGAFTFAAGTRMDGFVFTLTYTSNTTTVPLITGTGTSANFTNNTIRNCNIANLVTAGFHGVFLNISGTASNCLIENNKFGITSTDTYNNGTGRGLVVVTSGSKASNFIIRNNLLNYNFSTVVSTATANTSIGGLIVHLNGGSSGVVKNFVINNNEINYTGSTIDVTTSGAMPTATRAAVLASSSTIATDSILNCTVANNKTTNLSCAGINFNTSTTSYILQAYNNVAFNNQNTVLLPTPITSLSNMSTVTVSTGGLLSNNFTNGAGLSNASLVTNNDNTQTATDNSAFLFSNPTTYIGLPVAYVGNPVGQSAVSSLWSFTNGSYLGGKGLVSSDFYDMVGNSFATPPSVGAYAFVKQSQSITFGALASKVYGAADYAPAATSPANSVTYTSSNTAVATIVSNQIHIVGVGTTTITASQAATAFYTAAVDATQDLTVTSALNYFVDFSKSDDSGNGTTWETAKKTISAASALGTTGDNIYIKGGTFTTASQVQFVTNRNYYGSCDASNTGTATGRSTSDLDLNGITESWEFTNPTVLNSTYGNSAAAFAGAADTRIDGFVFTLTYLSNATNAALFSGISSTVVFTNNTIRNCNIASKVTGSFWSLFLTISGAASNCLIENNKLAITSTVAYSNGTGRGLVLLNAGAKASNFIIRNNLVNCDFSTVAPAATANTNLLGLILHVGGTSATVLNTVAKNFVINNNEINYTGSTSPALPTATRGAVISFTSTIATDSILNCTVANNKTTNLYCAGISVNSAIIQLYNNVLYNNQNDGLLSNMTIPVGSISSGGLVSNNVTNGAGLTNGTRITNNDNTQAATSNTVFKFRNPTTYIGLPVAYLGNPVNQTAVAADWTLTSGSYLAAKGMVASNLYDKAGRAFASPRAVGAYELQNFTTTVSFNANGTVNSYTNGQVVSFGAGAQTAYTITPTSGYQISSVLYNGVDVTSSLVGNVYTAAAQYANATLAVTFDVATGIGQLSNGLRIFSLSNSLELRGLTVGDKVIVSDIRGIQIKSQIATDVNESIALSTGVYLVRVNGLVKKVVVQ